MVYRGQSPLQIEILRARGLSQPTAANQPERIRTLKTTANLVKEAAEMDAPKDVKEKTFLKQMKKAFGDFSKNPVVRNIARRALSIIQLMPSGPLDALEFLPPDLLMQLQQDMNMDRLPEPVAKGGIMSINDMTGPIGV